MSQSLDASYAQNDLIHQTGNMPNDFGTTQQQYTYDQSFEAHQQANINPAELSKMSSPQDHASPNLLSPDNANSPGQPASPTSTNGQYYTPQHSRHQSLDPSSAYAVPSEYQNAAFQNFQHHRTPSNQSEVSSNTGYSPNLGHPEVFDSVENHASPYMHPQPDTSNDYGLGAFSLQPQPSPGHSPYVSPRLMPNQGLGLGQDLLLNQPQSQMPGPEIYTSQAESYSNMPPAHNRHGSTLSDMGQADQFAPPTIQIDPAPVSRQNSFEPGNNPFGDGNLSPRTGKSSTITQKVSLTLTQAAVVHCPISLGIRPNKDLNRDPRLLQDAHLPYNPPIASPFAQPLPIPNLAPQVQVLATNHAALPHHQSTHANTYLTWLTLLVQMLHPHTNLPGFRNTQPTFNATYARRNSPVLITFDHIFAHTLMSDPLFVPCAGKHSPANTTANVTKGCILVRRSLSAKASFTQYQARCGDAAADLLERTP